VGVLGQVGFWLDGVLTDAWMFVFRLSASGKGFHRVYLNQVEAADERRLARLVARYGRLDLLLIDEVGYVQLDARGAELLFQVLTEREEKSSVGLASNLPFSEWGGIIADDRLVAAVIDRVTFNAHIIETGTESYRHRTSRTRRSRSRREG
jgi:DNA replication protein DnaC